MPNTSDRRLCPRCSGELVYDGRGYSCLTCSYRVDAPPDRARPRGRKPKRKT